MFLCAVARPCYDYTSKHWFEGKLGIWPFVKRARVKRNSKNPKAGTIVDTPVSVTAPVYKAMIVENLLTAIKAKWPRSTTQRLKIQEDNASPHSTTNALTIGQEALLKHSLHVEVVKQPPRSPTFNALDCGIFNSIQKKVYEASPKSIKELISCVKSAFDSLHRNTIDDVFLSVQSSMRDSLKCDGDNTIPLSHMGKARLCHGGQLSLVVSVDYNLLSRAWNFLERTEPEPDSGSDCDSSVASQSDYDAMSETEH